MFLFNTAALIFFSVIFYFYTLQTFVSQYNLYWIMKFDRFYLKFLHYIIDPASMDLQVEVEVEGEEADE